MKTYNRITVYLGSSGRCRPVFKETAAALGSFIGQTGNSLVYGGMDSGLMGIVANHALAANAPVTGIIPKSLKDSERIHPNLTETILVRDLWERKLKMFKRADIIITLAGGFGTLDEALEALYWAHLRSHKKPVIFINTENYWDDLLAFIQELPDCAPDFLLTANSVQDAFSKIESWSPPTQDLTNPENLPHFEDSILQATTDPIIIDKASIKDCYHFATAVGLKQLGRHTRPIGLLNTNGQFDLLIKWINHAQAEHFITDRCTQLFSVDSDLQKLQEKMHAQQEITIDLAQEKWGPSETNTHIQLKETS